MVQFFAERDRQCAACHPPFVHENSGVSTNVPRLVNITITQGRRNSTGAVEVQAVRPAARQSLVV